MGEGMTVDELRTAVLVVRRFLGDEVRIRQRLQVSQPWKRDQWRRKELQAAEVKAAYERIVVYVTSTEPASRLEAAPRQQALFTEIDEVI